MSDTTPPSYIDDGICFSHRLPPATPSANASHWLASTASDAASAYTGSYVDDGADLLLPTASGFGRIDPCFYKHKRRRNAEKQELWNDDIARAVGGDVSRSLGCLKDLAQIEVRKAVWSEKDERERSDKRRGVVRVPVPLKWGTFIVKGDDGRVIVVGEDGEYDSGPIGAGREALDRKKDVSRPWVKAASSTSTSVLSREEKNKREELAGDARLVYRSRSKSSLRIKSNTSRLHSASTRPISIPDSDHHFDDPVKAIASPTESFMTGGLSRWPTPVPAPNRRPHVVPHSVTWAKTSTPDFELTHTKTNTWDRILSPSGEQCFSPVFPVNSSSSFIALKAARLGQKSTKRDRHSPRGRRDEEGGDFTSTETRVTYEPPDIVEVTYDETPPGELSDWGAGRAASAVGWNNEDEDAKGWDDDHSIKGFGHASAVRDSVWEGSAKDSGWARSRASSQVGSFHGWNDIDQHSNHDDCNDWDGFERPKTTSEVSVAGSGSERSWPASQRSTHQSYHSRQRHDSAKSWSDHDPTKYRNGFDEDSQTYPKETWDTIPVREASQRTRVGKD